MSLNKYLESNNMELFKKEIESSTNILLKTILHLLINKNWLKEQQKSNNKHSLAIVIIINNKI